jgi:hypothetical protein
MALTPEERKKILDQLDQLETNNENLIVRKESCKIKMSMPNLFKKAKGKASNKLSSLSSDQSEKVKDNNSL